MLHSTLPLQRTFDATAPVSMHLVIIAWLYVALMMAVAEATNSTGTVLGAIVTFVLYGLLPMALVAYLGGTPARRRAMRAREREQDANMRRQDDSAAPPAGASGASDAPDQRGEAAADPVASIRKEP